MIALDHLGVPYATRGGPVFSVAGAVDLGRCPTKPRLGPPSSLPEARAEQAGAANPILYEAPLSRHAQQLVVLNWLRGNAGFDTVVSCTAELWLPEPQVARVTLDTGTGAWVVDLVPHPNND